MRWIGTFILAVLWSVSYSQEFPSLTWHEGFLITADQDTIRGKIKYDLEANSVQISNNQILKALSSYKVFYFEIYDEVYENYRQFYSIPYKIRPGYTAPVIFELLYEGGLSLLAREKIVQDNSSTGGYFWTSNRFPQHKLDYDFYFLDKRGNMTYFSGNKNELLQILRSKQSAVKKYMKDNKLRSDEMQDLIRIISFYNSI